MPASHAMSIHSLCNNSNYQQDSYQTYQHSSSSYDSYDANYQQGYDQNYQNNGSSSYSQDDRSRHLDWATPDDWDRHQEIIRHLYLDEKKPLKDVVLIMEQQYGFRATAKMYKTRLAKWKMLKNRPRGSGH